MLIFKSIYNFRGTCSSVEILKGYMVRERLGTRSTQYEINVRPAQLIFLLLDLNLFQKSIITRSLAQNTLNNVIFSAYFFNCCANANFTLATVLYGSKAYAMIHLPIKII